MSDIRQPWTCPSCQAVLAPHVDQGPNHQLASISCPSVFGRPLDILTGIDPDFCPWCNSKPCTCPIGTTPTMTSMTGNALPHPVTSCTVFVDELPDVLVWN